MESKIIRTTKGFNEIKDAWMRIETAASWVSYFSTFRYNYDWWKQYENNSSVDLFIITIIHNQEVVGIAPLQIVRMKGHGYKYSELQFLHGGGDYSNFLVHPEVSAEPAKIVNELLAQIAAHQTEYDRVNLTHICQYSLLAHQILISKNNQYLNYLIECPLIDFSKYSDFESYTKVFIPKKIKQYINRFRREVDYSVKVTNENLVKDFARIHIAEKDYLKEKGFLHRHSLLFENKMEASFKEALYENNNNVLTYLLIDNSNNEIICYYTGYVFKSIFHSVTTAYHPKYAHFAVGKIFNYMIFEENFKNHRWDIFDMGTGRYSWKFEMTDCFNLLYQYRHECFRKKTTRLFYKLDVVLTFFHHFLHN